MTTMRRSADDVRRCGRACCSPGLIFSVNCEVEGLSMMLLCASTRKKVRRQKTMEVINERICRGREQ
jgi:hypothetical protein